MSYMTGMKTLALSLLASLFVASPALASVSEARSLLDEGRYAEARVAALEERSVESLNLAAEIMGAEIMLMTAEDAKDMAKDGMKLASEALERDPSNTEARFLYALHTGFRTRASSPLGIVMGGWIGKTKDAIESFAAAAPGDPRADALRGAWHLGIVRAAGDGKFDASLSEGMARYDAAVAAMPDDVTVLSNYAFSLIVMDDPALLPRAKELMEELRGVEATDAFERETKARMMALLAVVDQPEELRSQAKALLNTQEE